MRNTMFRLFRQALRKDEEKEPISLDREAWRGIYKLSSSHDMTHLIGYALKDSAIEIDADIKKAFERKADMAVFRYAKMSYELEAIEKALEKAKVRFIPLKGSRIRKLYREPWLRTSCDIDILVAEEDVERVRSVFESELNYTYKSSWHYEHTFVTPTKIEIELHHVLCDEADTAANALSAVWERSAPAEGRSYHYEMSDEMFYLYHIAHMAKHFAAGGCGIRPFMDVWILNHATVFDKDKRYALLADAGLCDFAKASESLADSWFGNAEPTELTEKMEAFILSGGTYGSIKNRVSVQQVISGGKRSYIFSRIFWSYEQLKVNYPKLEKRKWMAPFYQVKRWFHIFRKGKLKSSIYELKTTSAITSEQTAQTVQLLNDLGLG